MRQNYGAANHLVGVLGIDAEPHGDFHGLVELGELDFLQERNRVLQGVGALFDSRARLGDVLSCFVHCFLVSHRFFGELKGRG